MAAKIILLIETDDSIREVVTYVLKAEGFEIVLADPALAALMRYTTADLILIDEWINTNSSDMLCREIKAVHDLQHIPVIVLSTALNIEEIAASCKADGFLRKPFDLDELVTEIKRCLGLPHQSMAQNRF